MKKRVVIFFILLAILSSFAYAHEEELEEKENNLEQYFRSTSVIYVLIGSAIVVLVILYAILKKNKTERLKWTLFFLILIPVILITLYVSGSTIYLNLVSETKGPIHWHADFEIWNCEELIEVVDPKGLSNREGTAVLHEHNDNRIHVEGVLVDSSDADLHSFFDVLGGSLSNNHLTVQTNQGVVSLVNGNACNGREGRLQVFVYKITNPQQAGKWSYTKSKINNFESYILSPYSQVPPGDCIIIEFDEEKNQTEKICETYKVAIQRGELSGS